MDIWPLTGWGRKGRLGTAAADGRGILSPCPDQPSQGFSNLPLLSAQPRVSTDVSSPPPPLPLDAMDNSVSAQPRVPTDVSSPPLPLPLDAMHDSGSYGETLEGATSCRSCQTCTTITRILRTSSETGFFENRDSVISWRSVIGQLIQAGDPDWVIEDWMPDNDFWIRYIEWETLSYRAAVGCPTCRVIQDGILVFLSDDDFQGEGRPRLEVNVWCRPEEAPSVSMSVPRMKLHLGRYTLHLHRNPRTNAFLWPLPSIPAHLQKESRDDKISNIKLWMKECSEEHADCNTTRVGSMGMDMLLPKRVVDVSPPTSTGEDVRLHESSDGEVGAYVCLSHCWGDFQPLQTTRASLQAWKANIPWAQVPQTQSSSPAAWGFAFSGSTASALFRTTSRIGRSKHRSCGPSTATRR